MKSFSITLGCALAMVAILAGCKALDVATNVGTKVGVATGTINEQQAEGIKRSAGALGKAFEDLTPEHEYYIGRSVAATILSTYKAFDQAAATQYLNTLGKVLAMHSEKPETFGGWHFMIMDTDEINAFAAPGGFILVSRGMLRCCRNEDELAAVLAHEVGHVQREHGLRAISKSRWTSAATIMVAEAGKNIGGQQLAELTSLFEGSISDVTKKMVDSGYAQSSELEADSDAVVILRRVGYNPEGLINLQTEMIKRLANDKRGFAKTHPDMQDRVKAVRGTIGKQTPIEPHPARQTRFNAALAGI